MREGAEAAWADSVVTLYRARYLPMVRLAFLLTGSNELAEEIVQDAFIRLRDRAGVADLPSYLRATVVNACRDHHRRAGARTAAWSPDGSQIALVRAPDIGPGHRVDSAWYDQRRLWVEAPDGSDAFTVPGAGASPGVTGPVWSADGRSIGYSLASGFEVIPVAGGRPTVIASGLTGGNDGTAGPDAAGKQPWGAAAAWGGRAGFESYGS